MTSVLELGKRGSEFLGVKYPVIAGAMSWISESTLVSAVSNAGGFGVLAASAMNPEQVREEIKKTKSLTNNPFGVNLILMHPQIEELLDVCIEENVSHVVLAAGLPKATQIKKLKENGVKSIGFAVNLPISLRLIKNGIDALIVEGSEAGGHIGHVSTSVLAQEILPNIKDVPLFVAGGIGTHACVNQYLQMGASGVQVGTLFAACKESIAHENFKNSFIRAQAKDAQPSVQLDDDFPVVAVRAINNKASTDFKKCQLDAIQKYKSGELSRLDATLQIEHFWAGALRRAVVEGDVETGSLMAGQSVGFVKEVVSVSDVISKLMVS